MKKFCRRVLMLLFSGALIVSVYQIGSQLKEYAEGEKVYADLETYVEMPADRGNSDDGEEPSAGSGTKHPVETPAEASAGIATQEALQVEPKDLWPTVDFAALSEINPDIVGWLCIEDTGISYPVVQGSDNQYYLRHMFNGAYNSSGSIFLDSCAAADFTDRHSIIYGHHMKNGIMFSELDSYKTQSYYAEHPYALLMTPRDNSRVEFFAGYVADVTDSAWNVDFSSDEAFAAWLTAARESSCFESDVSVAVSDRVLTLSTCSYEFDNARFVLVGVLRQG